LVKNDPFLLYLCNNSIIEKDGNRKNSIICYYRKRSFFFLFILELIRKKRIKEQYSLLWFFFGLVFIILSVWRESLELIAHIVGIAYPPSALLLILVLAIFLILIQFSVIISGLSDKNDRLIQEVALLKEKIESFSKERNRDKSMESDN